MKTTEKLAAALREIGLEDMAVKAAAGGYDDFLSESAMPIHDLVNDLAMVGTPEALKLRDRAINGDFDATAEESEAWAKSPDGQRAFAQLMRSKR